MIDLTYFKDNYGSDQELIKTVLTELLCQLNEVVDNYPTWLNESLYETIEIQAHKLKSSLAYIGLADEFEIFNEVEAQAKSLGVSRQLATKALTIAESTINDVKQLL